MLHKYKIAFLLGSVFVISACSSNDQVTMPMDKPIEITSEQATQCNLVDRTTARNDNLRRNAINLGVEILKNRHSEINAYQVTSTRKQDGIHYATVVGYECMVDIVVKEEVVVEY
ncbi:hypothetical protein L0B53_01350 [Vibrio sp. SS-MA-C1-2]|uniref:hypothetical protein n=1 Tax=Vibrio sp. SS-MA-C1-2 TaxID=2908646 RepID=UPI001F25EF16|nr:hypothetical protein [Vibrio sp. SS-MA-C1-2]UJF17445.1 hypothetical protein L0B53_01350 [Vibrio sp. SS-MA-C1-2]